MSQELSLPPKYQIEALLFASGKAMPEETIVALAKLDPAVAKRALKALQQEYEGRDSALVIWNDDSGWKMTVREAYVTTVKRVVADTELSRACLETLAVIAYKYPGAMQAEIVDIRGSGAYEHIAELEHLGFVLKEPSGRSFKLKLTEKFFQYFDVAGGKDIRTAFKNIKLPSKMPAPEMQQTLGVEIVPVTAQEKKNMLDGMPVVDVSENPEIPMVVEEARAKELQESAPVSAPAIKLSESVEHRAFLDDLDKRIEALASRNDAHDSDPLLQRRLSAQEPTEDSGDSSDALSSDSGDASASDIEPVVEQTARKSQKKKDF